MTKRQFKSEIKKATAALEKVVAFKNERFKELDDKGHWLRAVFAANGNVFYRNAIEWLKKEEVQ